MEGKAVSAPEWVAMKNTNHESCTVLSFHATHSLNLFDAFKHSHCFFRNLPYMYYEIQKNKT